MEPESFNIDDYIKDGKLNLTEKTYRKYDKDFIATKIIDKIQRAAEKVFCSPEFFCLPAFFQRYRRTVILVILAT